MTDVESRIRHVGDFESHFRQSTENVIPLHAKVILQSELFLTSFRLLEYCEGGNLEQMSSSTVQRPSALSNRSNKGFWTDNLQTSHELHHVDRPFLMG